LLNYCADAEVFTLDMGRLTEKPNRYPIF